MLPHFLVHFCTHLVPCPTLPFDCAYFSFFSIPSSLSALYSLISPLLHSTTPLTLVISDWTAFLVLSALSTRFPLLLSDKRSKSKVQGKTETSEQNIRQRSGIFIGPLYFWPPNVLWFLHFWLNWVGWVAGCLRGDWVVIFGRLLRVSYFFPHLTWLFVYLL